MGLEGPNNGYAILFGPANPSNSGEVSYDTGTPFDADFRSVLPEQGTNEGNATVLNYKVNVQKKGFLTFTFVYGSDEVPAWVNPLAPQDFNDSFMIFVDGENIVTFTAGANPGFLSMFDLLECGNSVREYFKLNQIAQGYPNPGITNSPHAHDTNHDNNGDKCDGVPWYDVELSAFSKVLKREIWVRPGEHTIKFVIQDVYDRRIDAAVFIETDGAYLNRDVLVDGDYNNNKLVEQGDLDLVLLNWGQPASPPPAGWVRFLPQGVIDQEELDGVLLNWGSVELRGDFDRDGDVDGNDLAIWQTYNGLEACASRFEGDADADGDVDCCDLQWWEYEMGLRATHPAGADMCVGGGCAPDEQVSEQSILTSSSIDHDLEGTAPTQFPPTRIVAEVSAIARQKALAGDPLSAWRIYDGLLRVFGAGDVLMGMAAEATGWYAAAEALQ